MSIDAIAATLAAHRMTTGPSADVYCTCGWHYHAAPGKKRVEHDTHLALAVIKATTQVDPCPLCGTTDRRVWRASGGYCKDCLIRVAESCGAEVLA